jgi:hypothetical protein
MTSPLWAPPPMANRTTTPYGFLLVVIGVIAIFASSIFTMLPSSPLLPNQHSAFATFLGENGKITFDSYRDGGNYDIYVMNAADGTEQINISNNRGSADGHPDWGTATTIEDTIPPVITVPEDITEEATGPDGTEVSFEEEVTAEDDVDGAVDVSCDYNSGDTFSIGETVVTCSTQDAAGNRAEESFKVTVQDTTDPDVQITEAVDRRRNTEIPDGSTIPIPYIRITFEATDAVGIDETECRLDGQQAFTSCTSPVAYDRLSRETHEFTVRATYEAGNTEEKMDLLGLLAKTPKQQQHWEGNGMNFTLIKFWKEHHHKGK